MTHGKQIAAVLGLCGGFLGLCVILELLPASGLTRWQHGLHWNYTSHIIFIVLPLAALASLKRKPREYGLHPATARRELVVGVPILVWLFAVPFACEVLFGELRLRHQGYTFVVSTVIFQIVFSGFGEELLFRGFFQGEFDRLFGKRFRFGRTHFGWGLMITSVLFGVGHLLNPFNPLRGQFCLDWSSFVVTMIVGLGFGFIRARFDSVIAASLVHGGWDLFNSLYDETLAGEIGMGVGGFVACAFLGYVLFAGPPNNALQPISDSASNGAPSEAAKS